MSASHDFLTESEIKEIVEQKMAQDMGGGCANSTGYIRFW